MTFITRPFKFIVALPFYAIAIIATLAIMVSTRVIDWVYPDSKTSVTFMRALLGFNSSAVSMDDANKPMTKYGALRIYR